MCLVLNFVTVLYTLGILILDGREPYRATFSPYEIGFKNVQTNIEIYAAIKISIFFHGPSHVRQTERTESLGADFILYFFYFL